MAILEDLILGKQQDELKVCLFVCSYLVYLFKFPN